VTVRPLESTYKQWFTAGEGAPSRHRFTVEIGPGSGLDVQFPRNPPRRDFVPLSRLRHGHASIATSADAAALDALLARLISPDAILENVPGGILDACRWGARECVADRGAAGAIVSPDGRVRPCTHAPPLAVADDTLADLTARYQELAAIARARRECDSCVANQVCSHCLFPVALDDRHYCELIRRHHSRLPILHRLLSTLAQLDEKSVEPGPVRLRRWPRGLENLAGAAAAWNALGVWIVERGRRHFLQFAEKLIEIDLATADLGAALGDGKPLGKKEVEQFSSLLAR
jgi:radical SAM protein with 4Fe4S-binding SPASM domain